MDLANFDYKPHHTQFTLWRNSSICLYFSNYSRINSEYIVHFTVLMTLLAHVKHEVKVILVYVIKLRKSKGKGKGQTVTYLRKHTGEAEVQLTWMSISLLYLSVNTHVETCGRKVRHSACYKTSSSGCVSSEIDSLVLTLISNIQKYIKIYVKYTV